MCVYILFKVWDVKAIEDNDEDVSYGTDCLKLHMDEPYYDGHPGINFLYYTALGTVH